MKKIFALLMSLCLVFSMAACGGDAKETTTAAAAETTKAAVETTVAEAIESTGQAEGLKVALSNSILTNQWRVLMVKIFEKYCEDLKAEGIVSEYYATSSGDDAQAQINEIKNLIAQEYDIILVDCASDALSSVLEEAAAEGITVVTFDNICPTENTYSISVDAYTFGKQQAEWLCEQLGGEGNILIVRGKAGAADDEKRYAAQEEVLAQYPNIKVVGMEHGNWDYGTTAEVMNSMMAANEGTQIHGVLQQGMGEAAVVEALEAYGYDPAEVAITGEWTNGYFRLAVEKNLNCFITGVPCYLSAQALDYALQIVNGEEVEQNVTMAPPVIAAEDAADYYLPDQSDDFMPVFTDADNTWNISLEDILE